MALSILDKLHYLRFPQVQSITTVHFYNDYLLWPPVYCKTSFTLGTVNKRGGNNSQGTKPRSTDNRNDSTTLEEWVPIDGQEGVQFWKF